MSQTIEVKVPDIGDFKNVPVIEVLVAPGAVVKAEEALCTLESDKATMEVPAPVAGVVKEIRIQVGDRVSEGSLVLILEQRGDAEVSRDRAPAVAVAAAASPAPVVAASVSAGPQVMEVRVPDIGDFKNVPVIEVLVAVGSKVQAEEALVTLESDKATLDVPSPVNGVVRELKLKQGDRVSQGSLVLLLESSDAPRQVTVPSSTVAAAAVPAPVPATPPAVTAAAAPTSAPSVTGVPSRLPHASPSVRRFARELGVDVAKVSGTGLKGRILHTDVQAYIKAMIAVAEAPPVAVAPAPAAVAAVTPPSGTGLDLLPWPEVDFSKFGLTESRPLSRINKISAANLTRNWVMIPAVTYHEEADITELEAFRVQVNQENAKAGTKLTMLAFIIKACVKALQKFPNFNASLAGDNLILKKYYHIGFAADTEQGLVVPVIKDADKKSVSEIAAEAASLAKQAREGKIKPTDMQGACFTISSVGGMGGTGFSPIINAPEVAILGVSKAAMKPVWNGEGFTPRLTLPLALTADHRVIDGAAATRFNSYLAELLADFRRVAL